MRSLICRASRARTCATIVGIARVAPAHASWMPSKIGRQVADRHPFGQQRLQHPLHAAQRDLPGLGRHQFLLLPRQLIQQLLRLGVGQQLRHVLAFHLRSGVSSARSADRQRYSHETSPHPSRRAKSTARAVQTLVRGSSRPAARAPPGRVHRQQHGRPQLALAGLDLLHPDHIAVGWNCMLS